MALKKARVLRDGSIDGQPVKANQLVLLSDQQTRSYAEDGSVDASPEAVEYCEKELGAKAARPGKAAEAEASAG